MKQILLPDGVEAVILPMASADYQLMQDAIARMYERPETIDGQTNPESKAHFATRVLGDLLFGMVSEAAQAQMPFPQSATSLQDAQDKIQALMNARFAAATAVFWDNQPPDL